MVTNINFLPTISIPRQEIRLWVFMKWSPTRKCHDLLSNSLNYFIKEMHRDQFEELVCWYWGLKGKAIRYSMNSNGTKLEQPSLLSIFISGSVGFSPGARDSSLIFLYFRDSPNICLHRDRISSVGRALDWRAVGRGFDSRDRTITQGLKITEKWRYSLCTASG